MNSDVLFFVETWTLPEEEYNIPNFTEIHRIDGSAGTGERSKRGIIVFGKQNIANSLEFVSCSDLSSNKQTYQNVVTRYMNIYFVVLYRNSKFPISALSDILSEVMDSISLHDNAKLVIIGDFNICRKTNDSQIENILAQKRLHSLFDKKVITTVGGTQIDWVWTNINTDQLNCSTFETAHSYHDGIALTIK